MIDEEVVATERDKRVLQAILSDPANAAWATEHYELCPVCRGRKIFSRIITPATEFRGAHSEILDCSHCGYTGVVPTD